MKKEPLAPPFPSPATVQAVRNMFAKSKDEAKAIRESKPGKPGKGVKDSPTLEFPTCDP